VSSLSSRQTFLLQGVAEWRALRGLGACHFAYAVVLTETLFMSVQVSTFVSNCVLLSIALCVLAILQPVAAAQDTRTASPAEVKERIAQVRSSTDDRLQAQALELGRTLIRTARYTEAAALLDVLVEKQPDDYATLYFAALATFNAGRAQDAELLVGRAVDVAISVDLNTAARKENAADSLVLLAVVLAVRNKDTDALKAAEQAVQLVPSSFDAQFVLGRALFGTGDYDGAVKAFRKAVALKPSDSDAQFFLATALERSGNDAAALVAYQQLASRNPQRVEGHLGLGVLLVKKGGAAFEDGLKELKAAIAINPKVYEARVTLGRALVMIGRPADALEHLKVAADLAPNNPEPHYQLSLAYRRLGRKEEAARESAIVKRIHESRRGVPGARKPGSANY
jgi:tetratricopeptide (TPR) repeat protein